MFVSHHQGESDPRLRGLTVCIFAGMAVLLAGLWYVQVISSKRFVKNLENQSIRTVRMPATRGRILDCNGVPLADNSPKYNINLYLEDLRELFKFAYTNSVKGQYLAASSKKRLSVAERRMLEQKARYLVVSNVLGQVGSLYGLTLGVDEDQFAKRYQQSLAMPWPVLTNLSSAQAAIFLERPAPPPGLDLEIQAVRQYPYHSLAGHILGHLIRTVDNEEDLGIFFNYRLPDFRGAIGLEGHFDQELRGKAGAKTMIVDSLGYKKSESVLYAPEAGKNLVLTINSRIQMAAEASLRAAGLDTQGAAVVLDARNGDVLACASSPTIDPSLFVPRLSQEDWQRLNNPDLNPFINRATSGHFVPGSIFKIVVGLACLDAGLDPNEPLTNPGFFLLGNRHIKDLAEPGIYDFRKALKRSSNTYFIHHGLKLLSQIVSIGERLHLGEPCGLPIMQESPGLFPTEDYRFRMYRDKRRQWTDGFTANLCIGQGEIAVTPMQMAVMTAAVANGGKVFWPRLVQRIETQSADGASPDMMQFPPRLRSELGVSRHNLQIVRDAMLADVEDTDGTGREAAVPGFRICGKTGTAQTPEFHNGQRILGHHTWFVSFGPYESPRYVVVVLIVNGASGGTTCAPLAKRIYEAILKTEQSPAKSPLTRLTTTN